MGELMRAALGAGSQTNPGPVPPADLTGDGGG